ncbi:MAG: Tetracycline resistance efflux pump [Bacteriovoracaceae bacterium]|nr:Tetracycline resistance efflux pump [Bacteriovoracaceae bacterium]
MRKSSKLVVFLVVFIDLLGFGIMIPLLPIFARSFQASATELGALMFVYSFMQIFVSPLWGSLSDRFGRRPILLITIGGQALAYLWAGYAGDYFSLLWSRVFAGIFAANISTASAYMADITTPEERAKGMGLIGAAFGLGFVFGPAIGGGLLHFGLTVPSLVAFSICAANLVFAYFVLKEPAQTAISRAANRRKFSLQDFREILAQPIYFVPIFLFFLLTTAFVQLEVTFILFILDRFRFTQTKALYLLAFMGVVMAFVQGGLIGRMAKKFQEARLVLVGIILIVLGLSSMVFSFSFYPLVFSLIVLAFGYSLTNPCLSALVSKAAPADRQGSVLGIYQSGGSMARILGPLLAGPLYDLRIDFPLMGSIVLAMIAGLILTTRIFWNKTPASI